MRKITGAAGLAALALALSACASSASSSSSAPAAGASSPASAAAASNGSTQATYDGHPLYTYIGDHAPGQDGGNDINLNGGVWHVVVVKNG